MKTKTPERQTEITENLQVSTDVIYAYSQRTFYLSKTVDRSCFRQESELLAEGNTDIVLFLKPYHELYIQLYYMHNA